MYLWDVITQDHHKMWPSVVILPQILLVMTYQNKNTSW